MENCGTLQIRCNKNINFALYDFGISQAGATFPYVWGGVAIVLQNGETVKQFYGLDSGNYTWFVRKKNTVQVIMSGTATVFCSNSGGGSANIKTFFFSNVFQSQNNNYIFDLALKKITVTQGHQLFGANFDIINSSFNGVVIRTIKGLTSPNLSQFEEVTYYQNSFYLTEMELQEENLFSVTVGL